VVFGSLASELSLFYEGPRGKSLQRLSRVTVKVPAYAREHGYAANSQLLAVNCLFISDKEKPVNLNELNSWHDCGTGSSCKRLFSQL
jgi:hypothetical protein